MKCPHCKQDYHKAVPKEACGKCHSPIYGNEKKLKACGSCLSSGISIVVKLFCPNCGKLL